MTDTEHQQRLLEVQDPRLQPGSHLDVWDGWVEVLPNVDLDDLMLSEASQGLTLDNALIRVQRQLEPLISELWAQLGTLSQDQRAMRDEVELALIAANDAMRANDRSLLRTTLLVLLGILSNVAAGVGANLIWTRFGARIEELVDLLL